MKESRILFSIIYYGGVINKTFHFQKILSFYKKIAEDW